MIDLKKDIFPFNEKGIKAIFGKRISVFNMFTENEFIKTHTIELLENGSIKNFDELSYWQIKDGCLLILNKHRETVIKIDSLKSVHGEVYFHGENLRDLSIIGMLFKEEELLKDTDKKVGFLITSCEGYYQHTLGKICRSLLNSGAEKEDIFIVICHAKENEHTTKDGYNYIFTTGGSGDGRHFESIVEYIDDYDYLYLIHDTCEVDNIFGKSLGNTDISVKFDVCLAHKDFNIGLYSCLGIKKHLSSISSMNLSNVGFNLKALFRDNGLITYRDTNHTMKKEKVKDFYGQGVIRSSYYLVHSGIFKYFQDKVQPRYKP